MCFPFLDTTIVDRFKEEGYDFIFLIPLEEGEKPIWYASSRIHANPNNFSIEQLAQFIESKIKELGGEIKQVTFDQRMNNFQTGLKEKQEHVSYLESVESMKEGEQETKRLLALFNKRVEEVEARNMAFTRFSQKFSPQLHYVTHDVNGQMGIGDFMLQNTIRIESHFPGHARSSQFFKMFFAIFPVNMSQQNISYGKAIAEKGYRFNKSGPSTVGWSEEITYKGTGNDEMLAYFFRSLPPYLAIIVIAISEYVQELYLSGIWMAMVGRM